MVHQSRTKPKRRCHPVDRSATEATLKPCCRILPNLNTPELTKARRHAKIARTAYFKHTGDQLQDWLLAEREVDAEETSAGRDWEVSVYAIIIAAFQIVTGIPVNDISSGTPLPEADKDRRKLYSLIAAFVEKRPVDLNDDEDGYSTNFGELIEEVFLHLHWVAYLTT